MIIAQIFLISLVVLVAAMVVKKYRERKIGGFAFLLWLVLWIGAAVVILFPQTTIVMAESLGIGRGVDLVLYVSIIFILYLLFRLYVKIEQVERGMTQVVRAIALRDAEMVNSNDKKDRRSPPTNKET